MADHDWLGRQVSRVEKDARELPRWIRSDPQGEPSSTKQETKLTGPQPDQPPTKKT